MRRSAATTRDRASPPPLCHPRCCGPAKQPLVPQEFRGEDAVASLSPMLPRQLESRCLPGRCRSADFGWKRSRENAGRRSRQARQIVYLKHAETLTTRQRSDRVPRARNAAPSHARFHYCELGFTIRAETNRLDRHGNPVVKERNTRHAPSRGN